MAVAAGGVAACLAGRRNQISETSKTMRAPATIAIRSNPRLTRNRHSVVLEGAFGAARLEIEARPSPDNPQSSLLAAYSVLALLAKIASPIQF